MEDFLLHVFQNHGILQMYLPSRKDAQFGRQKPLNTARAKLDNNSTLHQGVIWIALSNPRRAEIAT
jgi:hypothetical protein